MILQALYQLAQREGLMEDPDYEPKPVAWLVRVAKGGKLLGIEGTHAVPKAQGKKKPKLVPKDFSVPREKPVTSGDRAFFLFGKSEYVLGQDPEPDAAKKRPKEKLESRFRLFRERVRECYVQTKDEGVEAVHRFLEDVADGHQTVKLPEGCASNDLFSFVFAPDVDKLVTERERVRSFWKTQRGVSVSDGAVQRQCLVSGAGFSGQTGNFPPLKKVPGGSTSGVALVSFNSNAFESYGLEGNDNAPISRDASEACATALNRLLHPAYPDPYQPGQSLPKRRLSLSADTVVCFWAAKDSGEDFCNVFAGLLEANPETVKEVYRSIWRGRAADVEDPSAFYALTLTGTQGRAIVRDWFESTVQETQRKLAAHFADLDIVRNTPKPRERDHPPQMPLPLLLKSLAVRGDSESIPAPLAAALIEAALRGTPYPLSILQRALERERAEIRGQDWADLDRRDARAALIKAVLNRWRRFSSTTRYQEVKRDMDPTNSNPGYRLGALMAVLERLQQEAIGETNASVVDRYFSGASASPKSVFVRLLKNARHHVRKAKDDEKKRGFVFLLDRLVDELVSGFCSRSDRAYPAVNAFPAFLPLEDQGLFVLGYHHMRKWLWMAPEEREAWQTQNPAAPRAFVWKTAKKD